MRRVLYHLGGVFVALAGVLTGPPAEAGPISCARVIAEIDKALSRPGHRQPDSTRVARRLGVQPSWVQRCAQAYGRRLSGKVISEDERRDNDERRWEAHEREEDSGDEGESPPASEPRRRQKLWPDPWADEFDPNRGINPR